MKQIIIKLNTKNDAVDFVSKIASFPAHIDLKYGNCMIDAKSILGVLGVAVGKKVSLSVHPEDFSLLEEKINEYIVA